MTVVPCVLLDHVNVEPAQGDPPHRPVLGDAVHHVVQVVPGGFGARGRHLAQVDGQTPVGAIRVGVGELSSRVRSSAM